ncbi:nicotinate phosphoribosyltransferase [Phenylobacterium deserti]|uniref:Nicotinate phosphoribosyltransferase n=1 Tax=Phenylobacterium deserti TaxID=1914756 RepID=A0A328AVH4_9CAUL|nr:nicotinate phosphoribosyltransferase [Phenylobacterium deserti]RAK57564.1 nicotinate phosphoribosyltransferase [Phenylobacterium deserti]
MDYSGRGEPLVHGLLDTDFYKLAMLQLIWLKHCDVPVTFSLVNRTRRVRIADEVDLSALRQGLDAVQALRLTAEERRYLETAEFYGRAGRFAPEFLDWLEALRLPPYNLSVADGQLELQFRGSWAEVTLWEIPALTCVTARRAHAAVGAMSERERDTLYACAIGRVEEKAARLSALDGLALTDFGTRRRHSFAWQKLVVQTFKDRLGSAFRGTSNVRLAMELGLPAVGTNGHEMPMVLAALADRDEALLRSPYQVLEEWRELYDGGLLVVLPDTFGSAAFFRDAPDWVADWKGVRPDSAPPLEAGEALIDWWRAKGRDPLDRTLIFSDALDIGDIEQLHAHFRGRAGVSFGWGTKLTNDLEGCAEAPGLHPISLVCKVTEAGGRPAVKLSDNPAKATGDPDEIARYIRVFGRPEHMARQPEV